MTPSLAWLRQLGPSWTSSERTFRHGVSPSSSATAATRSCIPRKSLEGTNRLQWEGEASELGRSILKLEFGMWNLSESQKLKADSCKLKSTNCEIRDREALAPRA
jgi:hypothetical protein